MLLYTFTIIFINNSTSALKSITIVIGCNDEDTLNVTLTDVMQFITGSKTPPQSTGIGSLHFSEDAPFPTASTCTMSLTLPTQYEGNYSRFREKCSYAFKNSTGFGLF